MKTIRIASFIALTSLSLPVIAAVQLPVGWYLEGNGGVTATSNTDYGAGTTVSNPGMGYNINAGYKFMPYFAGELGYTRYATSKIKFNGTKIASSKQYSVDLAGKGILPFVDSGFELFAKVGIAGIRSNVSVSDPGTANAIGLKSGTHTHSGLYLGAGGDYSITPNIPINLQWARAFGDDTTGNVDLYSIGIAYIFD